MRLPKRSCVRSFGGILVRHGAGPDHGRAAADRAELARPLLGPLAALAAKRLDQHLVGRRRRCGPRAARPGWSPRGCCGLRSQALTRLGSFSPVTERTQKSVSAATTASAPRSEAVGESGPTRASPIAPTSAAPVSSGSCSGSSPDSIPADDEAGEDVAVGAAELEALGLDARVDRLGEKRVGEPAAAQRAPGESLDGGGDPLVRRRPAPRLGDGGDRVDLALRGLAEYLGEELGLGGEMAVDGPGGDPGRARRRRRPGPRRSRRGRSGRGRRRRSAPGPRPYGPRCARWGGRAHKK